MTAPRQHFDLDAIKDILTVPDVLEWAVVVLTDDEMDRCSTACPIHGGVNERSFTWYDDGRRWCCFSGCGGDGGDVIDLIKKLNGVEFPDALAAAAQLAGIEPGPPPDPEALRLRREEQKQKTAERARLKALKNDAAAQRAERRFYELKAEGRNEAHSNARLGRAYLASRGLQSLAEEERRYRDSRQRPEPYYICYEHDGSVACPIWGFHELGTIINLPVRKITGLPNKVMTVKDGNTLGTIGDWRPLAGTGPRPKRVILLEGIFDYLTAITIFPDQETLCIGANGAGNLPKIVAGLAGCRLGGPLTVSETFMKLPLILVPHDDGADGAGAKQHAAVLAELWRIGKTSDVTTFDLQGSNDLNEWHCQRMVGGQLGAIDLVAFLKPCPVTAPPLPATSAPRPGQEESHFRGADPTEGFVSAAVFEAENEWIAADRLLEEYDSE